MRTETRKRVQTNRGSVEGTWSESRGGRGGNDMCWLPVKEAIHGRLLDIQHMCWSSLIHSKKQPIAEPHTSLSSFFASMSTAPSQCIASRLKTPPCSREIAQRHFMGAPVAVGAVSPEEHRGRPESHRAIEP